jgi:ferredoxin
MVGIVNEIPRVDPNRCIGCTICGSVCPTVAISVVNRKAVVDYSRCTGCRACFERCPEDAITMEKLPKPRLIQYKIREDDPENLKKIDELCRRAGLHPEQIICFCTSTRAKEVAQAILDGVKTIEDLAALVGVRSGCKVECMEPIQRLYEAAGIKPERKPFMWNGKPMQGYQWYWNIVYTFRIPEKVKAKYEKFGYRFSDDERVITEIVEQEWEKIKEAKNINRSLSK